MSEAAERLLAHSAAWGRARDRRAIFAEAYGLMTTGMDAAVEAGQFDDPTWVGTLRDVFAGYYFTALDEVEAGRRPRVASWARAFDACTDPREHPLQVLFHGVNAHINADLPFALADVLADWDDLGPNVRDARLRDHLRVNDLIAAVIDVVQDDVVDEWADEMDTVDRLLGRADEWSFTRLITLWREQTWHQAAALHTASADDRGEVAAGIHRRAERIGRMISFF